MKISVYKGLYTLTQTKNGKTQTLGSSWNKKDLEQIKNNFGKASKGEQTK